MRSEPTRVLGLVTVAWLALAVGCRPRQEPPSPGRAPAPWPSSPIDSGRGGPDGIHLLSGPGAGDLMLVVPWEEGGSVRLYRRPTREHVAAPWPAETIAEAGDAEGATLVDVDADGQAEVISCHEGSTRKVLLHTRTDGGWTARPLPVPDGRRWMTALALGAPGPARVVVAGRGPGAQIGLLTAPTSPGGAWSWRTLRACGWVMSLEAADLDGDGDRDVVYSDRRGPGAGVGWLEHPDDPDDAWPDHPIGLGGEEVMFLAHGDLDRDGRRDLVVAVKPKRLSWLAPTDDPRASWRVVRELALPANAGTSKGVAIGDVTGDGRPDLVASCEQAGRKRGRGGLWCLAQPAAGAASAPWESRDVGGPGGEKFDQVVLLDVDADGDLDVLTCEERELDAVLWYANPLVDEAPGR